MNKIITLTTDFELAALEKVNNLNPRQIRDKMLEQGYEYFILVDPYIKKLAGELSLPIENDLEFLIESYLYLEELSEQEVFSHNTFLGDGVLEIKIIINSKNIANIIYKYCPHLNRANLVTYELRTTKEKVLIWWRNALSKLAEIHANL